MQQSPIVQDTARLMQVSSNEVTSKATGMLKSEINQKLREEVDKMDNGVFTKV